VTEQVSHSHKKTAKIKISFNNIIEILAREWINAAKLYLLIVYLYVFRPGYVITRQLCRYENRSHAGLYSQVACTVLLTDVTDDDPRPSTSFVNTKIDK
jgi:hypothetical protein